MDKTHTLIIQSHSLRADNVRHIEQLENVSDEMLLEAYDAAEIGFKVRFQNESPFLARDIRQFLSNNTDYQILVPYLTQNTIMPIPDSRSAPPRADEPKAINPLSSFNMTPVVINTPKPKAIVEKIKAQREKAVEALDDTRYALKVEFYYLDQQGKSVSVQHVPFRLIKNGEEVYSGHSNAKGLASIGELPSIGHYTLEYGRSNDSLVLSKTVKTESWTKINVGSQSILVHYDDAESTPIANLAFELELDNGQTLLGQTNDKGRAFAGPLFGEGVSLHLNKEADETEVKAALTQANSDLDTLMQNLAEATLADMEAANASASPQQELNAQLREIIETKLSALRAEAEEHDNQSWFVRMWRLDAAIKKGIREAVVDYFPDLGEFGELLDSMNMDVDLDVIISAFAFGDIDELEAQFREWQQRNQQGFEEASETMEIIILLLRDEQTRETLLSLPLRFMEVAPTDVMVEYAIKQAGQVGIDASITSAATAGGVLLGGVGAPLLGGIALTGTSMRKSGKVVEAVSDVVMDTAKQLKTIRNKRKEPIKSAQHTSVTSSQSTNKVKKDKTAKTCKFCNKPQNPDCPKAKRSAKTIGNNQRDNSVLIAGIRKKVPGYPNSHRWFTQPGSLEIHHIIPCEAVVDSDWKKLFDDYQYDINEPHNSVVLPADAALACELKVQRHKGSHNMGMGMDEKTESKLESLEASKAHKTINEFNEALFAIDDDYRYPKSAANLILKIDREAKLGKFCHSRSGKKFSKRQQKALFEEKMSKASSKILNYISEFSWTIAWDSRDYQPGSELGCCNTSGISEKRGLKKSGKNTEGVVIRSIPCEAKRNHGLGKAWTSKQLKLGE